MATQYTDILKLALPTTGELDGTWGEVVNNNITSMVEEAIAGLSTINTWTANSHTLTTANGTTSESRAAILVLTDTGTTLTGAGDLICPDKSKAYIVKNDTGQTITVKTSAGTGVDVPDGEVRSVFCDATNVIVAAPPFNGQFEDGTAAAPSITFSSDTDTGFFKSAANIIGFTSGGVSRGFEFGPSYLYLTKGITGSGVDYLRSDMLLPRLDMDIQTSTNYDFLTFKVNGSTVGRINVTPSNTSYVTSSDYRLKENVVDMTGAVDRVKSLNPSQFNFIAEPDRTVDGFLAHEVADVVPEAVTGTKDAMTTEEYEVTPAVLDDDGNVVTEAVMGTREVPDYQGIDQSKLVPLLTGALQEAIARIETLEAQVATLQGN